MTKKEFIKDVHKQIESYGVVGVDWGMLSVKIVRNDTNTAYRLSIETKENIEDIGYKRKYKGFYRTIEYAQKSALNEIINSSKMYGICE